MGQPVNGQAVGRDQVIDGFDQWKDTHDGQAAIRADRRGQGGTVRGGDRTLALQEQRQNKPRTISGEARQDRRCGTDSAVEWR